jgi:hypothetical protein
MPRKQKPKYYKVKKEDLIGEIKGIPIDIVQAMVIRQVTHGDNPSDVRQFQSHMACGSAYNGFNWSETPEGDELWREALTSGKFLKLIARLKHTMPELKEMLVTKEEPKEVWLDLEGYRTLHKIACQVWKDRLYEDYGKLILQEGHALVKEEDWRAAVLAASSEQLTTLTKVFGKDPFGPTLVVIGNLKKGEMLQEKATGDIWIRIDLGNYLNLTTGEWSSDTGMSGYLLNPTDLQITKR